MPWLLATLVDDVLAVGSGAAGGAARHLGPALDRLLGLVGAEALYRLNRLSAALLGLAVVRAVMASGQAFAITVAGERIVRDLRAKLYGHLLRLGPGFYVERRVGELISRLINDIAQIQMAVTSDLASFMASVLTLLGALALLLWSSWRLTLVVLGLIPILVVFARLFGSAMRRYSQQYQDRLADATAVAEETTQSIQVVQAFTREAHEQARFDVSLGRLYRTAVDRGRALALYGSGVAALSYMALVLTVWFGGREVIAGRMSTGDLVAYVAYSAMLANSSSSLVGLYARWASALGASRRVFALLEEEPSIRDADSARPLDRVRGRVVLEGVRFSYGDGRDVLRGIDLDIAPGERVALVGPSGAGKSTLLGLLSRFYDPTAGRVTVDGADLRGVTVESLRRQIGIVAQVPVLFNASVAENIRYGRLTASDDEVVAAAGAACAHGFVTRLPDGYATVVGERGVRLSVGERQRIAIARALLRDPALLLLDEATSSLDNESEHLVQRALERLTAGRTTIVIAHRLSTVHSADRIVVLDDGRLVEAGSHDELLEHCGLYARLYRLHLRDDGAPAGETVA